MLGSITGFILTTYLLHQVMQTSYPSEYSSFLYVIGYNSIYIFSKFQIFFNKHYKSFESILLPYYADYIIPLNEMLGLIEYKEKKELKLVKNGHVVRYYLKNELEFLKRLKDSITNDYDLIIYTDYEPETKESNKINQKYHRVVYQQVPEHLEYKQFIDNFIMCELCFTDGETYKLNFSTEEYNYLMEGNQICKKFLLFFLKEHYSNIFEKHFKELINDKYVVKLIDNNVNMIDLTPDKVLIIGANGENHIVKDYVEKPIVFTEEMMYPNFNTYKLCEILSEGYKGNVSDVFSRINNNDNNDNSLVEDSHSSTTSVSVESKLDDSFVKL